MLILKFIVCLIHVVHPSLVTMASSNMAAGLYKNCALCDGVYQGHGHNPWPISKFGKCCDECNEQVFVSKVSLACEKINEDSIDNVKAKIQYNVDAVPSYQHGSDDEQATATFYMEPKQNNK